MFLWKRKDGGPESKVYAWGIEIKSLGSLLLLKFEKGSREAYHEHAFNSISWLLSGWLLELFHVSGGYRAIYHVPSWRPIKTYRNTYHKVKGVFDSNWVLTFRGPWAKTWKEYRQAENREVTLTHGRQEIA